MHFVDRDPNSVLVDVTGEGKLTRRIQAGVYDDEILCRNCESRFSDLDTYGWKILGDLDLSQPYLDPGFQLVGYTIDCDTDKLRRFISQFYGEPQFLGFPFIKSSVWGFTKHR